MTSTSSASQPATRAGAPSWRGWAATVSVLAVVLASLWYGHAPPRSVDAYDKRAGYTVAFLGSQVRTAVMWTREHADGRVTGAAATVALDESVDDARVTLDRFTGHLPPEPRDELRTRIARTGSSAVEQLGLMRIAAHRGDWAEVRTLADDAEKTAHELERLAQGLPQ